MRRTGKVLFGMFAREHKLHQEASSFWGRALAFCHNLYL
jgi:hypothetical protein